jgi:fimbrial isopeptide formation D2 family protein/LPXTG-motif cell wall-anchored protein
MKKMRKIVALLIAMAMVLSMGMVAFASEATEPSDGSITITPPSGLQTDDETTYTIYKVFDATVNADDNTKVSYRLCEGDTLSAEMEAAGFSVDSAGNVTFSGSMDPNGDPEDAAIKAIAAFVTDADIVDTVTATGTTAVTVSGLTYGYYYITTTTGSLVTIDTTNIEVEVIDKNTIPEVDKKITGAVSYDENGLKALAQIGTNVDYEVTITVGKGAKGYVFHDVMDDRLAYNNDVSVDPADSVDNTTTASGDTITVTFKDAWLAENEGETITITYSAKITEAALSDNPAKNTATVDFGEDYTTTEKETEVYNAQISVLKKDGDGNPLADAGFVLANSEGKYYKFADGAVTWVDSKDDADEHFSDDEGKVAPFTGLANGTYTLIEKTVPEGYNQAPDQEVEIAEHDYTADNLEQEAEVTNNAGTELPSTGGIGTTLFYVVGSILVVGAVVVLISKRRTAR